MMRRLALCVTILAGLLPAVAQADDPHDPKMRSAAARARDHEIIRQLNLREAARVRERDARYAENWRAYRVAHTGGANAEYSAQVRAHERDMADYADRRAQHERDMAAWRRAVAACRAGDYSACDR